MLSYCFLKKNQLKIYNYFINITEEDISQELSLKKIKERNNYFIKQIDQNELLSNKNKKVCTTMNCIEYFITLVFVVTICISISAFASLIDISNGIMY